MAAALEEQQACRAGRRTLRPVWPRSWLRCLGNPVVRRTRKLGQRQPEQEGTLALLPRAEPDTVEPVDMPVGWVQPRDNRRAAGMKPAAGKPVQPGAADNQTMAEHRNRKADPEADRQQAVQRTGWRPAAVRPDTSDQLVEVGKPVVPDTDYRQRSPERRRSFQVAEQEADGSLGRSQDLSRLLLIRRLAITGLLRRRISRRSLLRRRAARTTTTSTAEVSRVTRRRLSRVRVRSLGFSGVSTIRAIAWSAGTITKSGLARASLVRGITTAKRTAAATAKTATNRAAATATCIVSAVARETVKPAGFAVMAAGTSVGVPVHASVGILAVSLFVVTAFWS
eukprot:TRINITY_DN9540_c0_g1_i6.p1 TRINITY_DN9540_c0_g1~~TRINITY_DN9540_c0_g1_i6.p1  ORF type:complete len:339 (+),score=-28.24 TRINITY_DN9540_c0_g1_i6:369-1385(+)